MKSRHSNLPVLLLVLLMSISAAGGYWYSRPDTSSMADTYQLLSASGGGRPVAASLEFAWPPRMNERFPDIELMSHTGRTVSLSEFKGKIILVEPVGMTCAACNAFSGAQVVGGYQGVRPQKNLPSIEALLPQYGNGVSLDDDRIILVQLLLYDMNLKAPDPANAMHWARHYNFDKRDNVFVLVGDQRFINQASYDMIPGFFLIDRNLILRSDSTGHHPKYNLFTHLLAMVPELLAEMEQGPADPELDMSVDAAYKAIPHKQTTFNPDLAIMDLDERRFLEQLFALTDTAMVQRVQTMIGLQENVRIGAIENNYNNIISQLKQLDVPDKLRPVYALVEQAILEQMLYLEQWQEAGVPDQFNSRASLVQQSHRKLIRAHQLLVQAFPAEAAHNKTAFFDHLCALDFI
jgi:hypothetical protein